MGCADEYFKRHATLLNIDLLLFTTVVQKFNQGTIPQSGRY